MNDLGDGTIPAVAPVNPAIDPLVLIILKMSLRDQ